MSKVPTTHSFAVPRWKVVKSRNAITPKNPASINRAVAGSGAQRSAVPSGAVPVTRSRAVFPTTEFIIVAASEDDL